MHVEIAIVLYLAEALAIGAQNFPAPVRHVFEARSLSRDAKDASNSSYCTVVYETRRRCDSSVSSSASSIFPTTMSTLRRFAQANRATQASPGANASGSVSQPATPNAEDTIPITPARKPRVSYVRSPADTPSISSSTPFDWDAVRNKRPPPYGTPPRTQTPAGKGQRANSSQSKRIVKRKGIIERQVKYVSAFGLILN